MSQHKWVIKCNGFCLTEDIEFYVVYTSHEMINYTLESVSSLVQITHNLQVTINLRKLKTSIKKKAPISLTLETALN